MITEKGCPGVSDFRFVSNSGDFDKKCESPLNSCQGIGSKSPENESFHLYTHHSLALPVAKLA